jgi:hypothetical protein
MTATYDPTLATVKDRLRFRLGDSDPGEFLLSDEEIAAVLSLKADDEDSALLYLAKGLIRRYSREPVRTSADGVTMDFSDRLKAWQEIVAEGSQTVTSGLRVRRLNRPQSISGVGEYTT